jgi:hypothetical protein
VLDVHPGGNTASFASGVGAQSMTTAYGWNRDWNCIPGGVVSGTALIRPDFPKLKDFPFLWQQGSTCWAGERRVSCCWRWRRNGCWKVAGKAPSNHESGTSVRSTLGLQS